MNRQQTLSLLAILFFVVPVFGQYVQLREKLDNDYVMVEGTTLKFTYQERYAIVTGENDEATCKIYDWQHHVVGSPITVTNQYGLNTHEITLPTLSPCETYLLEVSGTNKGEVYYLRFRLKAGEFFVSVRLFLNGCYDTDTNLMWDSLRFKGHIPLNEPYAGMGYTVQSFGADAPTTAPVLAVTGNNAIVDWVLLELRCASSNSDIVATRSALVQRDGDVVDVDGVSPVKFRAQPGPYHVAIRHRNHLGAMTASTVQMNLGGTASVDFTSPSTATWGSYALYSRVNAPGIMLMYSGDANGDRKTVYGSQFSVNQNVIPYIMTTIPEYSDRKVVFESIVNDPNNYHIIYDNLPSQSYNWISHPIYSNVDLNMTARIIYMGAENEIDIPIFFPVLFHPANSSYSMYYEIIEQLP